MKGPNLNELKEREIIIAQNYWENFKFDKDLSMSYPPEHPKRIRVHKCVNDLLNEWNELKKQITKLKEDENS